MFRSIETVENTKTNSDNDSKEVDNIQKKYCNKLITSKIFTATIHLRMSNDAGSKN